jgi:hypothetical protein
MMASTDDIGAAKTAICVAVLRAHADVVRLRRVRSVLTIAPVSSTFPKDGSGPSLLAGLFCLPQNLPGQTMPK